MGSSDRGGARLGRCVRLDGDIGGAQARATRDRAEQCQRSARSDLGRGERKALDESLTFWLDEVKRIASKDDRKWTFHSAKSSGIRRDLVGFADRDSRILCR